MRYLRTVSLFVLLVVAAIGLNEANAQSLKRGARVIYVDRDTLAEKHPYRQVSDKEYLEAYSQLKEYLEKELHIPTNEIAQYNFTEQGLELSFKTGRADTTLRIPSSLKISLDLVANYSATKIEEAEEQIRIAQEKADKVVKESQRSVDEARKRIKLAERRVRKAERKLHHKRQKEYSEIAIAAHPNDSLPDGDYTLYKVDKTNTGSVTTISREGGKIEIRTNDEDNTLKNGKTVASERENDTYERVTSHKNARRVTHYRLDDDDDAVPYITNEVLDHLSKLSDPFRFRGHWVGIELGFNWLLSPTGSFKLENDAAPMRINMGSAINCNVNFLQYSIPLGTEHFGIVLGLGTHFNHYRFKAKNTFSTGDEQIVFHNKLQDEGHNVKSSRFFNWSLSAPLLFEFQNRSSYWKRFYMATGVLGRLRLYSSTNIYYDKNSRLSESNSFNMPDLTYGVTLRLGYGPIRIYSNFYPMGFFESGQGPKVYPIELGMVILSFT